MSPTTAVATTPARGIVTEPIPVRNRQHRPSNPAPGNLLFGIGGNLMQKFKRLAAVTLAAASIATGATVVAAAPAQAKIASGK